MNVLAKDRRVEEIEQEFDLQKVSPINSATLDAVDLSATENQKKVAKILTLNYKLGRVHIELEGLQNLPDGRFIIAMNHTDKFSYWPLQYALLHETGRLGTLWVKGKHIDNPFIHWFFRKMGVIPAASKGFVIHKMFKGKFDRALEKDEYSGLKKVVDGLVCPSAAKRMDIALQYMAERRDDINFYQEHLMNKAVALSKQALVEDDLYMIIFPEGTRKKNLAKGFTGLARLALNMEVPVVPVACNGGDKIYPDGLPLARPGTVTFRFGEPLTVEDKLKDCRIPSDLGIFGPEAKAYERKFETATDRIMRGIHDLLDVEYRNPELYGSR